MNNKIEALYIHIPFCVAKCNYCDFLSFPGCSEELKERYISCLKTEAVLRKKQFQLEKVKLNTVFLGGGTPTCLSGGLLNDILLFIKDTFQLQDKVEISIEANPGTIDEGKLAVLKKAGVNRLSLGVQSFAEELLRNLGRIHSINEIQESFSFARKVGFTNINLDLMYGLPGQTIKHWEHTLIKTIELEPEHISTYQLKIEEGTPLGNKLTRGEIQEFDDEIALEMYQLAQDYLTEAGYIQYEVSNFTKPGFRCRHNCTYWLTKPYLGLGAGAHSFYPPLRFFNKGNLSAYLDSLEKGELPPVEKEILSLEELMSETMFMGLRLLEGVNLTEFQNRYKVKATSIFNDAIEKCIRLGLIEFSGENLRLTREGLYLGNLVFQEFI
ncbi:MAG: radical SAM family heme chaperone HemW [Clostridia bacterium]|nr:radical SAM family heme chaperone HemW [Clostridia bacterium]